jgi:hypothetical protein
VDDKIHLNNKVHQMSEQQVIADLIRKMHDRIDQIHVTSHTTHADLLHEIQEFKKSTQSINDGMDSLREHIRVECQALLQRDAIRQQRIVEDLASAALAIQEHVLIHHEAVLKELAEIKGTA